MPLWLQHVLLAPTMLAQLISQTVLLVLPQMSQVLINNSVLLELLTARLQMEFLLLFVQSVTLVSF